MVINLVYYGYWYVIFDSFVLGIVGGELVKFFVGVGLVGVFEISVYFFMFGCLVLFIGWD